MSEAHHIEQLNINEFIATEVGSIKAFDKLSQNEIQEIYQYIKVAYDASNDLLTGINIRYGNPNNPSLVDLFEENNLEKLNSALFEIVKTIPQPLHTQFINYLIDKRTPSILSTANADHIIDRAYGRARLRVGGLERPGEQIDTTTVQYQINYLNYTILNNILDYLMPQEE